MAAASFIFGKMTAAEKWDLILPEDYLAGETAADSKHEYLDGVVHAMAGGNVRHSAVASNILGALHSRLRGQPCRPFNSDILIRIQRAEEIRFYYPDVSVVCESNPPEDLFQDRPVAVIPLGDLAIELPLAEIYEGIEFN